MTLGHIQKVFEKAIAENTSFIAVAIKNGIQHDPEVIINCTTNFQSKLDYYMNAYAENPNEPVVELKHNASIRIVGIEAGNNPVVLLKKLGAM